MEIDLEGLEGALQVLGQLLKDRGYQYELAAVGGGSLLLMGLIDRTTKDLDLVALVKGNQLISADPLPKPLLQAALEVGKVLGLGKDWCISHDVSVMTYQHLLLRIWKRSLEGYHVNTEIRSIASQLGMESLD